MSLSVHHIAVLVADLDRAERFYSGVLGLTVQERWTDDRGAPRSVWLSLAGGAFLALERGDLSGTQRQDGAIGWHLVALGIAAVEREAWRQRLLAAGFPVERESPYTLYVRDPDRNWVGLSHHPNAKGP